MGHGKVNTLAGFARRSKPPSPRHSLIATLHGQIHPQTACILFSKVPAEVRNRIFYFAFYSYDDVSRPYPSSSYYSRPGYRYHQRISTNLLIACRRIYTEAHNLPISLNEHVFWCSWEGGPRRKKNTSDRNPKFFFQNMTIEQRSAIDRIHLFTQVQWLRELFVVFCELKDIHPKYLKISIRHTDWQDWDRSETPLDITLEWIRDLKLMSKLRKFYLELESIEKRKDQVDAIVTKLIPQRLTTGNSDVLKAGHTLIAGYQYTRPAVYVDNYNRARYFSKDNDSWVTGDDQVVAVDEILCIVSTVMWSV
ncbi:hypothetical protein JR316_0007461 [Psilocybe cubensis]|uniref:Uncharacterized protein n=2 Tax=Psilocybe cubensis TaxID=181762 RepID=A0ACB8H0U1_PSICU|nr:hypothetical protein JR316_0007461 [Psilocybe cubensis]KAH9480859.1 hypothetical protein JR316_0007461 [Psilocybe cubensis]